MAIQTMFFMLCKRGPAKDKKCMCFPVLAVLNTPNAMLYHERRAQHTDISCFGCLAGRVGVEDTTPT